jgi:hypothetical protein
MLVIVRLCPILCAYIYFIFICYFIYIVYMQILYWLDFYFLNLGNLIITYNNIILILKFNKKFIKYFILYVFL